MSSMSYLAVVERNHQYNTALGDGLGMLPAVWMMFAAVGLGLYVYLGARAEALLLQPPRQ